MPNIKQIVVSRSTVEEAIRVGLHKIALPTSKTIIKVLKEDLNFIFFKRNATVSITYDADESKHAIDTLFYDEFLNTLQIKYENSEIKLKVPLILFDAGFHESNTQRFDFLKAFLKHKGIDGIDDEALHEIVKDPKSTKIFITIKKLKTTPLNDKGSSIYLDISEDEMVCKATFFYQGIIKEDEIYTLLLKKGISHGFLRKTISNIINNKLEGSFIIAQGFHPINEEAGKLETFFHDSNEHKFQSIMDKLTINTRAVKELRIASRNDILLKVGKPIHGKNGQTITGKLLPKKVINMMSSLKIGKNVYTDDSGKIVYARSSGQIIWKPDEYFIDIEPIYVVSGNVDFTEGNIIGFVGKVIVKGDVKPKFSVTAEGDIEIQGNIEDSTVESLRGNVTVKGYSVNRKGGYIQAAKRVTLSIANNATVKAENIVVEKEALNCNFEASLNISVVGSPGVIVGGIMRAHDFLKANIIGSESWVPTKIHVGDTSTLKKHLKKTQQIYNEQKQELLEAKEVIYLLKEKKEHGSLKPSEEREYDSINLRMDKSQKKLIHSEKRIKNIKADIHSKKDARIEVLHTLYPQVDIYLFDGYLCPPATIKHKGLMYRGDSIKTYNL